LFAEIRERIRAGYSDHRHLPEAKSRDSAKLPKISLISAAKSAEA